MANQDLKQHFESILGRNLDPDNLGGVVLRENVGIKTYENSGAVSSREIGTTGETTKRCRSSEVLDVGGSSTTLDNGIAEFLLSDFYCIVGSGNLFKYPINLVATPNSRRAVYLTSVQEFIANDTDVRIRIFAWDSSGSAASNVSLDWRCKVAFEPIVG